MNVAEYLAGQDLSIDVETVNFAMHFPRWAVDLRQMVTDLIFLGIITENSSPDQIFTKH
jgi:hypothetical protein